MHFWALPLSLWTALVPCHGFSVDVEQPVTFQEPTDSFGQSVALLGGGAGAGLIVSAPLQRGAVNETGKIYKCTLGSGKCLGISIQRPTDAVNMSLGLSLATRNSQILACGPTVHQACGNNMYMKGYCFLLDQNLKELQRIPETLPECTKRTTDIVFLIDGSGSVSYRDFQRMKTFVSQIMTRFEHSDTLFSLVQFSTDVEIHFDFNEFRSSSKPTQQVMEVLQQRGWTNTITAIKEVLRELFVPGRGSRPEAAKVLIVVTDGKKTEETSYSSVISEAQKAGIIRYAIGVGNAFSTQDAMQELKDIASDPDSDHVFRVNDFSALQGIQDKLHEKIFAIEGTQSQNSSSFQLEMSQEGFSALLSPDGSVLGAVGAYDWSGGIFLYGTSGEPTFINMSHTNRDMNDAYLGYSAEVVQLNKQHSYVVGAPRHNHIGKAILFRQDARSREWRVKDEAVGTQVGSYFGATLCTVDLNKDTNTDLFLIGAPMYHDAGHGGRVYVCPLTSLGELSSCNTVLQGQTGHLFGRFGASMAQLGDISGDGRTDVVIGAPLENDNQGAVYVFQGTRRSINTQYSQRIEGSEFPSRLRFFGQAVSGGTDLMGDGLADVAVGALGQVLLLRSRPVLRVGISISFIPPVIPIAVFNCQGQEQQNQKASSARVCFTVTKGTKDALGDGIRSTLRYTLTLDPGRPKPRAAFNSISPSESKEIQIGIETKCETFQIILPTCIEDTLNPLVLRVNYTLTGLPIANTRNLRPILSQDSALQTSDVLPFEKNCGTDGKCDDVLQLSFNFSGLTGRS
uniref:VWFA domain-containing protein n=2 Tax=Sphenodon punctatus TaxID=8508 RepID=A0A8D0GT61_SPHPU